MTETTIVNELISSITELTETVKAHGAEDRATLDIDKLGEMLGAKLTELAQAQADAAPAYRGLDIGGENGPIDPVIRAGKFAGLKASELGFVAGFLKRAHALKPELAAPPSADLLKALDSTTATAGDELVPTGMAAEIWRDAHLAARIGALFSRIAMPTDPYTIPVDLGDVTIRKGTQNTATTATDVATGNNTLTGTEQVAEIDWSYSLNEDAIIPMLPELRQVMGRSFAEGMDAFVLNADDTNAGTGNINLDDADPADTLYYLSDGEDGIRHLWLADNTDQNINAGGDALADGDIVSALMAMGKYAGTPTDLAIICDVATYLAGLQGLDGVQTMDKYGPQAVLLTGELAKYRGIPIIVSASAPKTEADGKVSTTAGNNTLGQLSIVHRPSWRVGYKRELLVEVERDIQKRQFIMVASTRIAVACRGTRSSATHTAGIRNISLA